MEKRKMKFLALSLLFLSFSPLYSSEHLSLDKFLDLTIKNSPSLKQVKEEKRRSQYILEEGLPSREVLLQLSSQKGYGSDSEQTSNFNASLEKNFIQSGTQISLSHTENVRPDREEKVSSLLIEQPLLKNSFGKDTRLLKSSLEEEEELIKLNALETQEEILKNWIVIYLEYLQSYLDYKLSIDLLSKAKSLQKDVRHRAKNFIANTTDLKRSQLQLLDSEEQVLSKKKSYQEKLEQIHHLIGLKIKDWQPDKVDELILKFEKNYHSMTKEKKPSRRSNLIAEKSISKLKKLETLSKREFSPSLNLIAGYNKDNSQRFSTTIKRDEAIIGLSLEVPLGKSKRKVNQALAEIETNKALLAKELLEQNENLLNQNIKHQITELQNKKDITKKKIDLIKKILNEEERRYQKGQLELERVIELRSQLSQYQFEYQNQRIEYIKQLVQWLSEQDQLLETQK